MGTECLHSDTAPGSWRVSPAQILTSAEAPFTTQPPFLLEALGALPAAGTRRSLFPHFGRSGFRTEADQVSQGTGPSP